MKKMYCEISTGYSIEAIECILNNISSKDGTAIGLVSGKYLQGSINNSKFKYITYDSPPIEIVGTLHNTAQGTQVTLHIQYESTKGQQKALIYALSYPIFFGLLLFAIISNPKSILTYVLGLVAMVIPIIVGKLYMLFWHHEPDPDQVIKKLTKDLNGTATVRTV